ncbi:MAG: type II toxin-antitoxin system VapC family toxin [Alphaproteobacteria bacterium]
MTADKVADGSALAALLFNEPEADLVAAALQGALIYAPGIIEFEVANICWKKCRRHPDQADELQSALLRFASLEVQVLPIDLEQVVDLALRSGLSAYDASYLFVAGTFDLEVVTLDAKLAAAAKRFLGKRNSP